MAQVGSSSSSEITTPLPREEYGFFMQNLQWVILGSAALFALFLFLVHCWCKDGSLFTIQGRSQLNPTPLTRVNQETENASFNSPSSLNIVKLSSHLDATSPPPSYSECVEAVRGSPSPSLHCTYYATYV